MWAKRLTHGSQITLIFVLTILLGACSTAQVDKQAHQAYYDDYEQVLHRFNREIDTSLLLRKQAIEFFRQEQLEGDAQYFSAKDISQIQRTIEAYIQNRQVLIEDIAYRYRNLINGVELQLSTDQPTAIISIEPNEANGFRNRALAINPHDETGRRYIKVIRMGLAAALTLYDNFVIAIMPYESNGPWRRKINYDNLDNQMIIENISANFRDLDNYRDTLRVVEFNDRLRQWEQRNPTAAIVQDSDNQYFDLLIEGSYTNTRIKQITLWDQLAYRTQRFRRMVRDIVFDLSHSSMNFASKVFGNTLGLIASREGYLKNLPAQHKAKINNALKPGDILLEKTPFRYTDRFIPGHWGHVAIWVGSKEQLQKLGVWDQLPELYAEAQRRYGYEGPSFQSQIEAGHSIVEALRSGVQMSTLEHFLNIDDLAVLRDKRASKRALKRYLVKTFKQIGKEYDFNFDVETDTKIVCSELAFIVYEDYEWTVEETFGRYTISPDHIAEKTGEREPFEPVMLYHDGKLVRNNLLGNFRRLMKGEYRAVQLDLEAVR